MYCSCRYIVVSSFTESSSSTTWSCWSSQGLLALSCGRCRPQTHFPKLPRPTRLSTRTLWRVLDAKPPLRRSSTAPAHLLTFPWNHILTLTVPSASHPYIARRPSGCVFLYLYFSALRSHSPSSDFFAHRLLPAARWRKRWWRSSMHRGY